MKHNTKQRRRRGRTDREKNGFDVHHGHNSALIKLNEENASSWHEIGAEQRERNATIASDPAKLFHQDNQYLVPKYRNLADSIFEKELQVSSKTMTGCDERWVENTMKKGTLKDRIAAISVTVSADPIHKFGSLDGLLSMAGCTETGGKTNSRVAQLASEALEDLFVNTLLPHSRKLITLDHRPLYLYESSKDGKKSGKTLSPRILLLWRFEEKVKSKYDLFLRKYLSQTLKEGLEIHKIAALQSAASLLGTVPEGEQQLLAIIVNKLGDPGKKTSASAGHQLRIILQKHPNMQVVVAREVQQLAHRSHLSARALYNCVVFLNQLKLEKEEQSVDAKHENLPASLIKNYFRLFEVAVKDNGKKRKDKEDKGMNSRLLSALLSGVNRARPYLPQKNQAMEEHMDSLYRVVHAAAPSASTQALMLLFHLVVGTSSYDPNLDAAAADAPRQQRFYRALYASLSKPSHISHGKHSTMFFNLLYRAMKYDTDDTRVNVCAKRLMSTTLHANAATVAGSVFLLNEIARSKPHLRACFATIPIGHSSHLVLDDSKREPSAALVVRSNETLKEKDAGGVLDIGVGSPPLWELSLVSQHYHPSVSRFACAVGDVSYAGDPTKDFGLAPFLDKFSYRNPKSNQKVSKRFDRRRSIAERRSGMELQIQSRINLPLNDPKFLEQEQVNEQDEFFLKFFAERARRDELKGIKRQTDSTDADEDGDDEAAERGSSEEMDNFVTDKSFEEIEQTWETDSEEEAFVDTLAEQLIESAADSNIELDDGDPDTSHWSDYDDTEGGENEDEPPRLSRGSMDEYALDDEDDDDDDDDALLDMISESESEESMGNPDHSSSLFVNAEEYENGNVDTYSDFKESHRKKRRKTSE